MKKIDLQPVHDFLLCKTPSEWVQAAVQHLDILLIDHANCEKKAASTAMNLIFRYSNHSKILRSMSRLAREELRHFEQVLDIMERRNIAYDALSAAKYAATLHQHVRTYEPAKLVDILIVGAIIEARSCERFAVLAPHLDDELREFYTSLLRSEARHFRDYLKFAREFSGENIDDRVQVLLEVERDFIQAADDQFRFHSGIPTLDAH